MKNFSIVIALFLTSLSFSQNPNSQEPIRVILKFKTQNGLKKVKAGDLLTTKSLRTLNEKNRLQSVHKTGNKKAEDTYVLLLKPDQKLEQVIKEYLNTSLFEYVEPDYKGEGGGKRMLLQTVPNDNYFSRQYGLVNDGSFDRAPAKPDADIDMDLAWDIETGDDSIIVAVLDSGLKLDHPELSGRLWINSNESSDGNDTDTNGYADDLHGWDFANNDNDPTDDQGHGTNVTGIIGADAQNNLGYAGVDWHCRLMVCKVLDGENSGYYSWWAEAIYYAVDNGAKVINMSLGGSSYSNTLKDTVEYAYENGVVVVACMMNENTHEPYYPAKYETTIAVGATNPDDKRAAPFFWSETSGSNYGNHLDVVAPGNYIYGLNYQSNTKFNTYWGGTSQATPLVAGLSALLLAQDPTRSPDEIRNILRNTAEDQVGDATEDVEGFDIYYGYGRINAEQALLQNSLAFEEAERLPDLHIYPNPFSDQIGIKNMEAIQTLVIYNLFGVELRRLKNPGEDYLTVNLADLSNGLYIASFLDSGGKVLYSKKLVKK